MLNKLFSKTQVKEKVTYKVFGIKISYKDPDYLNKISKKDKKIQDNYDLSELKSTKKAVVFLVPPTKTVNGGIRSIFNLCKYSRQFNNDGMCFISTYPGKYTICENKSFENDEKIYRFEQITENGTSLNHLIIHIPEYFVLEFCKNLTAQQIEYLKSVKNLHLNIMNQNIQLMPPKEKLEELYKLTDNVTQTIAHDRYASQEVCDKWQIPTHLFSTYSDFSKYPIIPFEEREKIIVLSPDTNSSKAQIVQKLSEQLPDWELITVQNMTFDEYMNLISKAYFTITFGEGMDGYFSQPIIMKGVSFAVYNDDFFPDSSWAELKNIYSSYDNMYEKIVDDIKYLYSNKQAYEEISASVIEKRKDYYSLERYLDNLQRFYEEKYDFVFDKKGENI